MQTDRPPVGSEVLTEILQYPSRSGLRITACWDHRATGFERCPFVVLAPKFGESKKNNLQLAYYLAANGLNVIRFDHTSHVGESDGEPLRFTLPGALEDILGTYDHLEEHHGVASAGLIGTSLSVRVALRAAATDPRVAFFVSIVGVVNFRRTITAVNGEDTLGAYLDGRKRGVDDVLGFEIHFEEFLEAVFTHNFHDLEGTLVDARSLRIPVAFFAAGKDAWVELADVQTVVQAIPGARLTITEGSMHEVRENPVSSEQMFRDIVTVCMQFAYGSDYRPAALVKVLQADLLRQNRIERLRLRAAIAVEHDETVFWDRYLRKFDYIQHGDVYRRYLDLVVGLLGALPPDGVMLDVGCGNGFAGVCYLSRLAQATQPLWISVDLSPSGLHDAMRNQCAATELRAAADDTATAAPLDFVYALADLDAQPAAATSGLHWIASGTLDGVVSSLVVSYLRDPAPLLAELYRVLKPGGHVVVSSLKPNCDLSLIYRTYVEQERDPIRLESARDLLRAAGAIRLKEELGYYRFFAAEELLELLAAAGFKSGVSFRSLADQAVVVRAEK